MKSHNKSKSDEVKEFLEYVEKLILEDKLLLDVVKGRALVMGIIYKRRSSVRKYAISLYR